MKVLTNIFITLAIMVSLACGSTPNPKPPPEYSTLDQVYKKTKDGQGKVYVLFSAPWCESCEHLKKLLTQEGIVNKIMILNVDKTENFLFSRDLEVKGLPALVIFDHGQISLPRHGANKILLHLVNIEQDG